MNILTVRRNFLIVGAFVLAGMQPAQAQSAEDILNKADAIYSNARTYQATYHWESKTFHKDRRNNYSLSEMSEVKAIGMTKFALHMVADKPKGHPSDDNLTDSSDIYDDGKDHYLYSSGKDYYYRDTHDGFIFLATRNNSEMLDRIMPHLKPRKGFTYRLRAPARVNGKAAYVIEVKGVVKHMSPPMFRWVTVKGQRIEQILMPHKETETIENLLYIEQATFHLLQRKAKSTWSDFADETTQIIQSELLNAPIPDSAFVFVIPKGVTELGKN